MDFLDWLCGDGEEEVEPNKPPEPQNKPESDDTDPVQDNTHTRKSTRYAPRQKRQRGNSKSNPKQTGRIDDELSKALETLSPEQIASLKEAELAFNERMAQLGVDLEALAVDDLSLIHI